MRYATTWFKSDSNLQRANVLASRTSSLSLAVDAVVSSQLGVSCIGFTQSNSLLPKLAGTMPAAQTTAGASLSFEQDSKPQSAREHVPISSWYVCKACLAPNTAKNTVIALWWFWFHHAHLVPHFLEAFLQLNRMKGVWLERFHSSCIQIAYRVSVPLTKTYYHQQQQEQQQWWQKLTARTRPRIRRTTQTITTTTTPKTKQNTEDPRRYSRLDDQRVNAPKQPRDPLWNSDFLFPTAKLCDTNYSDGKCMQFAQTSWCVCVCAWP